MSGPNTNFDPKQVASLDVDAVEGMVADARAAFAAADDLDALKAARLAHAGDRSPLALANREIGALPPAAKADAGKRVGQARAAVKTALEEREVVLKEYVLLPQTHVEIHANEQHQDNRASGPEDHLAVFAFVLKLAESR